MPVEVMELVIKAQITSNNSEEAPATTAVPEEASASGDAQQEVVERVMEILKRKNER